MNKNMHKNYRCNNCSKICKSGSGLDSHIRSAHPYIPPEPPKEHIIEYIGQSFNHHLKNGSNINVGDKLLFKQIVVVKKVKTIEGDTKGYVDVDKITDTWEIYK
jgi:hypothetical protein